MPKTLGQLATEVLQKKYEKPSSGIPETDLANSIEQKFDDLADQVDDVRINGTSVVQNGIAYIPMASSSNMGAVKIHAGNGLYNDPTNGLEVSLANDALIKFGTSVAYLTSVANQHKSTFYGLAKAAGADMASSNNAVGTYTDEAKTAIQNMLGVPSKSYIDNAISNIETMDIHVCTSSEYNSETGVPTVQNPAEKTFYLVPSGDGPNLYIEWVYLNNNWEQFGSATVDLSNYVQKTDYATTSSVGVVGVGAGLSLDSNNRLQVDYATSGYTKLGSDARRAVVPYTQDSAAFYGLAKAAGSDEKDSSLPVGQYTEGAKTAIKSMLGVEPGVKVVRLV